MKMGQSGQTTLEYVALLAIVALMFTAVMRGVSELQIGDRIQEAMGGSFKRAYQYGHPRAKGPGEGGPEHHPRLPTNESRIFIAIPPRR